MRKLTASIWQHDWLALSVTATMTAVASNRRPRRSRDNRKSSPARRQLRRHTMDQSSTGGLAREGLDQVPVAAHSVVETYLQKLTQDRQLGPIPQDDQYFLGAWIQ